jgi:16S rRNA (guanine966-N2)-methyltransferase
VAPKGHSTRPTAERARQALFNVLEHAAWSPGLAGLEVIDLFAGSGALGLEALSRGAVFCLLVDSDPAALAAISGNVATLRFGDRSSVQSWDATRLPARGAAMGIPNDGGGFDLAFLDPPYAKGLVEPALAGLARGGWLAPGALAVVERGAGEDNLAAPGFETLDARTWGAARLTVLRFKPRP